MPAYISNQSIEHIVTPDTYVVNPETSIGIDEVRAIQKFVSRKPSQGNRTVVIINDAHLMTIPAQNSALKLLEEPPEYTDIYLVTNQPDVLLPTILSRCLSISTSLRPDSHELIQLDLIKKFLSTKTMSDRLVILDEQKYTRESLKEFIDQLEIYYYKNIKSANLADFDKVYIAKKYLQANCSIRLLTVFLSQINSAV